MAKCECQHEKDFVSIQKDIDRWRPILDGNGHEQLGTRLMLLEDEQTRNRQIMTTIESSQELLRRNVSSLLKTEEFRKEQEKDMKVTKNQRTKDTLQVVGLFLVLAGLLYEIIFK